jgi:tRNA A-37 threonylcarbamoyl transferase component Bud32
VSLLFHAASEGIPSNVSDNAQVAAGVREGDVLAGKYRIDKILGVGGMGVVVAAHHMQLDDRVAIKFLLPDALTNKEAVARFAREARAAVKIKSEHVARVSDVGTLENGAPYMVMEYLDGSDLSGWLAKMGVLPFDQAVEFVLQACEAIAEAHAIGIVHRDLKPANLFVIRRPDGGLSVKVLDFGISKTTGMAGSGSDMTRTSAVMGSPLYMSPEQMQSSKDADARSDIWAIGIILHELLTADSPFLGETMPELVLKIMSASPPPLRTKRPDAPEGLEAVILKCLNKDRGKRFQTVGELAVALLPFAPRRARASVERISGIMKTAGFASTAMAPSSDSDGQRPAGAGTAASWGTTSHPAARGPWIALAGVGAVVAIGGLVFVMRKPAAASSDVASASAAIAPVVPATAPVAPAVAPAAPTVAPSLEAAKAVPAEAVPAPEPSSQAAAPADAHHVKVAPKPVKKTPEKRLATPETAPTVAPAPSKANNAYDDRK